MAKAETVSLETNVTTTFLSKNNQRLKQGDEAELGIREEPIDLESKNLLEEAKKDAELMILKQKEE